MHHDFEFFFYDSEFFDYQICSIVFCCTFGQQYQSIEDDSEFVPDQISTQLISTPLPQQYQSIEDDSEYVFVKKNTQQNKIHLNNKYLTLEYKKEYVTNREAGSPDIVWTNISEDVIVDNGMEVISPGESAIWVK